MRVHWMKLLLLCSIMSVGSTSLFAQFDLDGDAPAADGFGDFLGGGAQEPTAEDQAATDAELQRLNQEAAAKKAAGDLDGAFDLFLEAAQVKANFVSLVELGRIAIEQGDLQQGTVFLTQALQSNAQEEEPADTVPAILELGDAYLELEQYSPARGAYANVLQQPGQRRNKEALTRLGIAQREFAVNQQYVPAQTRQEDLDQAIRYFDQALSADPDYPDALYERGRAYLLIGENDQALDDLNRAAELDPENTDAIARLGITSLTRGIREAATRKGQTAKILFDMNRAVDQLSQWLQVVPEDQEVDEDDPDAIRREDVLLNRSAAYIGLGDEQSDTAYYQLAINDADGVLDINPKSSDAFFQKGVGLRMQGDLEAAIEAFTESIELALRDPAPSAATNRNITESYLRRGIIFYRQGDLDLAKRDFEQAIRFTTRGFNPLANFWLGLCYQMQEDQPQAIRSYTKAIRMQPQFVNALLNRGMAYMKQGRYEQATRDFSEVLRVERDNAQARALRDQAKQLVTSS